MNRQEQIETLARKYAALEKDVRRLERLEQYEKAVGGTGDSSWLSPYMRLLGLRALWPMGPLDGAGVLELVNRRALTYSAGTLLATQSNGIPYAEIGEGQFLQSAEHATFDITGTEAYILSTQRGLTFGGWFRPESITGEHGLIGKWLTSGNQRSYSLRIPDASRVVRFAVSDDGSSAVAFSSTATLTAGAWNFVAGRYRPGNHMRIWVNGVTADYTTSIPSSLFVSTSPLHLGNYNNAAFLTGRISTSFVCAANLPDDAVNAVFEATRADYGV